MLNILRIANVRCCSSPAHHRGSLRVPVQRVRVERVVQRVQVLKEEVQVRMVQW